LIIFDKLPRIGHLQVPFITINSKLSEVHDSKFGGKTIYKNSSLCLRVCQGKTLQQIIKITRSVLDWFHDSSRVALLICLNLHSVLKAEKVCKSIFYLLFLAVQMQFFAVLFWCAVQIFWCAGKIFLSAEYKLLLPFGVSFCHLMVRILPPFGGSFAVLC